MDFEFSADQEMLRDSVRRFLADKAPISYVRDAYDDDGSALGRDDVWSGLRDIGASPARFDLKRLALRPAEFRKSLSKRRELLLPLGIIGLARHQHAPA